MNTMTTTQNTAANHDDFTLFPSHARAALYNLRNRRSKHMPPPIAARAEHFLCNLGQRLEHGEKCALGNLEQFLLCGARNWTHYAASALPGAEVCQETILWHYFWEDKRKASRFTRFMYSGQLPSNDYCVKCEGEMLASAARIAGEFLYGQAFESAQVRRVTEIQEAARTTPTGKDIFFAFGPAQFKQGLKDSGLPPALVVAAGAGLYGTRAGIDAFLRGIDARLSELKTCHPDALFAYEFANHESGYTGDHSAALSITRETFPDYEPTAEFLAYLFNAEFEEFDPTINA